MRVAGNKAKRLTLPVSENHPEFLAAYHAARQGIPYEIEAAPEDRAIKNTLSWLCAKHLAWLSEQVVAGNKSQVTYDARRRLFGRLTAEYGPYQMLIPRKRLIAIRDSMAATPAQADALIKSLRIMYAWALEREIVDTNPAAEVSSIDKGKGGAIPWTVSDLHQYRERHLKGTTAHLALTLLLFTGCRISDAVRLGREHETIETVAGFGELHFLSWLPAKKGSAPVKIPMLPPLYEATRAQKVISTHYLLTRSGRPFASAHYLGKMFRHWCDQAGLPNRSAHGVRKAVGGLLAEAGCTEHQIMAVLAHVEARTTERYTKSAARAALALDGMQALRSLEW